MSQTTRALEACLANSKQRKLSTMMMPLRGGQTITFTILYEHTGYGHGAKKNV